jgi:hypothetical protein
LSGTCEGVQNSPTYFWASSKFLAKEQVRKIPPLNSDHLFSSQPSCSTCARRVHFGVGASTTPYGLAAEAIFSGPRAAAARARDAALLDEAGSGARGLVAGLGRVVKERKVGAKKHATLLGCRDVMIAH